MSAGRALITAQWAFTEVGLTSAIFHWPLQKEDSHLLGSEHPLQPPGPACMVSPKVARSPPAGLLWRPSLLSNRPDDSPSRGGREVPRGWAAQRGSPPGARSRTRTLTSDMGPAPPRGLVAVTLSPFHELLSLGSGV